MKARGFPAAPQRCARCHGSQAPWHDHIPLGTPVVALVGAPNVGKTSLFNALTGQYQHTGNWPGKTVSYHIGFVEEDDGSFMLVDLPGLYSLSPLSLEERLAQEQLAFYPFDGVLHVVDASHLARDLYLLAEVLEMGRPVMVALNMWDVARREGMEIAVAKMESLLGVPVVPAVARHEEGVMVLRRRLTQWLALGPRPGRPPRYPPRIEEAVACMEKALAPVFKEWPCERLRWLALRLLEGQEELLDALLPREQADVLQPEVASIRASYQRLWGEDPALVVADARYGWAEGIFRAVVTNPGRQRFQVTRLIDQVVAHRWLGLPLFFLVMFLVFHLVINITDPFISWLEGVFQGPVRHGLLWVLHALSAPFWLRSLLVDGVLAGVGSMMTFLPGLTLLYLFLAWLEDSGYMARVAFVMDRVMQWVGLHGKAILPLILGLGCNVPAIYATRTLERWQDRLVTSLVIPFVSCSARLPIYLIFGLAFFGPDTVWVVWGLYVLGFVIALTSAALLHRLLFPQEPPEPFLLELPPYHWPNRRVIGRQVREQVREFVVRAGTVIVVISVFLWVLMNLPWGVQDPRQSWFGKVSAFLAPGLEPLGFGRWEASGALLSGMVAKEVVVSTMGQIYLGEMEHSPEDLLPPSREAWKEDLQLLGSGLLMTVLEAGRNLVGLRPASFEVPPSTLEAGLVSALQQHFTPAGALAFMVFALLYVPCMATLAALYQEFGLRWAAFALVYQVSVAWLSAWVIYHLAGAVVG